MAVHLDDAEIVGEPKEAESIYYNIIAQQQSCNVVAKGYYVWVFLAEYGVY